MTLIRSSLYQDYLYIPEDRQVLRSMTDPQAVLWKRNELPENPQTINNS